MEREWNDSQPIYRQLRDRVVALILDRVLNEKDPVFAAICLAASARMRRYREPI
jgi:GntR family transcriptional regulator